MALVIPSGFPGNSLRNLFELRALKELPFSFRLALLCLILGGRVTSISRASLASSSLPKPEDNAL